MPKLVLDGGLEVEIAMDQVNMMFIRCNHCHGYTPVQVMPVVPPVVPAPFVTEAQGEHPAGCADCGCDWPVHAPECSVRGPVRV